MRINHSKKALPFLLLALAALPAQAQVARVIEARGASVVERVGEPPRILGAGEALDRLDVIRVARNSHAIIEFSDRSRVSLRPDTVFRIDAYDERAPESVHFGLLKGGLRAETGRAGKGGSGTTQVQAGGAKVVVHGADFDVRLCEDDCLREQRSRSAPVPLSGVVARVVEMMGSVSAKRAGKPARGLVPGASIYESENIVTDPVSYVVLVFRDGSRIALAEDSRLAIPTFRFDDRQRTGVAEIHHLAGGARVQSGAIAKQGPEKYRFVTPLGVLRPHGTGWDSVVGGAKQAADKGADAARQTGETVVGAVQDTAGQAAQTALNAAVTPLLQAMSALMTDLRNNPPTTEAGWNELTSKMTRASSRLHGALDEAIRVGGSAVDSPAFKSMVGMALAAELEVYAVGASTYGVADASGLAMHASLRALVAGAKSKPYQSESLALVGLSGGDLERVSNSSRLMAHVIIETEVGNYLASQGNSAAREFFSKAEAAAEGLRQRAQQAEEAAARAAAETKQRAIADAERAAEEAHAAELEAERLAAKGKVRVEQAGEENAANPTTPVPGGAAPLPMVNPPPADLQESIQEGADSVAQTGRDVLGRISDAGQDAAEQVRAQGETAGKLEPDAVDLLEQGRKLLAREAEALNETKARDKALDQKDREKVTGNAGNAELPGGGNSTAPAILVWDGSIEVAGHVVNKGESLYAASDGQLVTAAGSGNPVINAPRPDLVKVTPGLFGGEIVSGSLGETIAKRFDRFGHDDGYSGSSSASQPPDGYTETYGYGTKQEPRNRDERNTRGGDAPPDGYTETYGYGTKQEPRNRDERNTRGGDAPPDGYTERYAYGAPGTDRMPGLYVWVRDGVITLNQGGRQVEVAAGNAVVVGSDLIAQLDYVPNFMRFDQTPLPAEGERRPVPAVFKAPDGSFGSCRAAG